MVPKLNQGLHGLVGVAERGQLANELHADAVVPRLNELVERQRVPELAHVADVRRRDAVIADANQLVERHLAVTGVAELANELRTHAVVSRVDQARRSCSDP